MAEIASNRLLPILGGLVGLVLIAVLVKIGLFGDAPTKVRSELRASLPEARSEPDADTPADTIRALQGQMLEQSEKYEQMLDSNSALLDENRRLRDDLKDTEQRMLGALDKKIDAAQTRDRRRDTELATQLQDQLDRVKSLIDVSPERRSQSKSTSRYSDIPVGFGLDAQEDVVWIEPLGAGAAPATPSGASTHRAPSASVQSADYAATDDEASAVEPRAHFTIPNLATLIGSTTFTALIGRVPIGGQVQDPFSFRVLVGRDNLAASGLRVPAEIVGMVMEGTAVGDLTLRCVSGSLHTATFAFQDGTIRTVSTLEGGNNARPNLRTERLGYIADRFGNPCISGRLVSNWKALMAARVGVRTSAAAAEAAAASESTTVVSGATGAITDAVDGSTGRYVLGRALSEGVNEIDRAIAERLSQNFDAIYVEPGGEVELLIQKEIEIDYDPLGRKLDHASTIGTKRTSFLD